MTGDNYATVVYHRRRSITLPRRDLPADAGRLRDYIAVAIRAGERKNSGSASALREHGALRGTPE